MMWNLDFSSSQSRTFFRAFSKERETCHVIYLGATVGSALLRVQVQFDLPNNDPELVTSVIRYNMAGTQSRVRQEHTLEIQFHGTTQEVKQALEHTMGLNTRTWGGVNSIFRSYFSTPISAAAAAVTLGSYSEFQEVQTRMFSGRWDYSILDITCDTDGGVDRLVDFINAVLDPLADPTTQHIRAVFLKDSDGYPLDMSAKKTSGTHSYANAAGRGQNPWQNMGGGAAAPPPGGRGGGAPDPGSTAMIKSQNVTINALKSELNTMRDEVSHLKKETEELKLVNQTQASHAQEMQAWIKNMRLQLPADVTKATPPPDPLLTQLKHLPAPTSDMRKAALKAAADSGTPALTTGKLSVAVSSGTPRLLSKLPDVLQRGTDAEEALIATMTCQLIALGRQGHTLFIPSDNYSGHENKYHRYSNFQCKDHLDVRLLISEELLKNPSCLYKGIARLCYNAKFEQRIQDNILLLRPQLLGLNQTL